MIYIGIDPGKTGAIAFLDEGGHGSVIDFEDKRWEDYLRRLSRISCVAFVEKQNVFPKQGAVSGFKLGDNYGEWKGFLKALKIRHELVQPLAWKKAIYDVYPSSPKGTPPNKRKKLLKDKSLEMARKLFPNEASKFVTLVKHHDRAEALLIAEYCRRTFK